MSPDTPKTDLDDNDDGSLEALREQLREQRKKQKKCLAQHKKTTFSAVNSAMKGTTFFDLDKVKAALDDEPVIEVEADVE